MQKTKIFIGIIAAVIIIILLWLYFSGKDSSSNIVKVPVKYGKFQIDVTTTGELEAKSSEKILGPMGLRNFRIWQIKIEDIITDGTVVDSGDYVASLDRTDLVNKMKDMELDVEQFETQYTKTLLDTTLEMRTARDNLINLKYNLEEKQIVVDQSIYEPPATQRQAKIDLDKANRNYTQAIENYKVILEKAEANMKEVSANLRKARQEYDQMLQLLDQFTIYAPKSGMVIYRRNWDGQKQGIGAQISVWDPTVAELPNLKEMISKTYVNEIDISKIKTGQEVKIGVDAFPDKKYTGILTEVANIGQQMPNSNAKVFEVIIEVNDYDSILRPAMTTKNEIITAVIDSIQYLPIECVHTNDSLSYVFISGLRKQVLTGATNENEIIIKAGLETGDMVYLVPPEDPESYRLVHLDPDIVEKFKTQEKEQKEDEAAADDTLKMRRDMMQNMSPDEIEKMKKNRKPRGNREQKQR